MVASKIMDVDYKGGQVWRSGLQSIIQSEDQSYNKDCLHVDITCGFGNPIIGLKED